MENGITTRAARIGRSAILFVSGGVALASLGFAGDVRQAARGAAEHARAEVNPAPGGATPGDEDRAGAQRAPSEAPVGSPLRALDPPAPEAPGEGRVVERLAAGPYSYLRLEVPAGAPEVWVATVGAGAPVGSRVALRSFGSRRDFVSRRLGRTFPRLELALVSEVGSEEKR